MFKNHPKGLLAAAISNMGERFGYYIMNAVLVLFLCSKFGLALRTNINFQHQYDISENGYKQNRNGNKIPRNIYCITKPVYRARRNRYCYNQYKKNQKRFFHIPTAFLCLV